MNTFGASAYLKAERDAVTETLQTLQERLRSLKMEELSIRAEIRYSMTAAAGAAGDTPSTSKTPPTSAGSRVWTHNLEAAGRRQAASSDPDEMSVNQAPLELDIDEALKIISRYKTEPGTGLGYEEVSFLDAGGGSRGAEVFEDLIDEVEEEEEEEDEGEDSEVELQYEVAEDDGKHFFGDFSLGREIDRTHNEDVPGPSFRQSSTEVAGKAPKMPKMDD